MPIYDPMTGEVALIAVAGMKVIDANGWIRVLDVEDREETLWYRVDAWTAGNESIGVGWVNSQALVGQTVTNLNEGKQ